MRIFSVFFHPNLNFTAVGGAEKRFIEILKVWDTKRLNVTVIDPYPRSISANCVNCEVIEMLGPLHVSGKGLSSIYLEWLLWTIKACFLCPAIVKRKDYDFILAPNNTLPNLIVAYLTHVTSSLPMCTIVHHMDFPYVDTPASFAASYNVYRKARFSMPVALIKAATFFLILALLKRSDALITVSNHTAQFLLTNGIARERVGISGNGVDTNLIDSLKVAEKSYDGIFVGRIARDKGVFDLVRVWKRIASVKPQTKLMIVGSGPDFSKLKEEIEESNMASQIILAGRCEDSELFSLMKASKIFLFPSRFEGWGLAVAEALACGLPVVCYGIPALREIFGQCGSVFFVPTGNTTRFTEVTERILKDADFEELEAMSKEYVKRFSWEKVALNDIHTASNLLLHSS